MAERRASLAGLLGGVVWAILLVFGVPMMGAGFIPPQLAIPGALIAPGLVFASMTGWRAFLRFRNIPPAPSEGPTAYDSTRDHLLLAAVIWPFGALTLGGAVVLVIGFNLAILSLVAWFGQNRAGLLRDFAFAGNFCPTLLVGLWSVYIWMQ